MLDCTIETVQRCKIYIRPIRQIIPNIDNTFTAEIMSNTYTKTFLYNLNRWLLVRGTVPIGRNQQDWDQHVQAVYCSTISGPFERRPRLRLGKFVRFKRSGYEQPLQSYNVPGLETLWLMFRSVRTAYANFFEGGGMENRVSRKHCAASTAQQVIQSWISNEVMFLTVRGKRI